MEKNDLFFKYYIDFLRFERDRDLKSRFSRKIRRDAIYCFIGIIFWCLRIITQSKSVKYIHKSLLIRFQLIRFFFI